MNQQTITKTINCIKDFIDYANKEVWEEESRITLTIYSGRNMFGAECYGIVARSLEEYQDFVSDLEDWSNSKDMKISRDIFKQLRKPKIDSLGYDEIFYFPFFTFQKLQK